MLSVIIVNDGDIGMVETGQGPGFGMKSPARGFVAYGAWRENLDGDVGFEVLIVRTIDLSHATLADFLEDEVMPQRAPD